MGGWPDLPRLVGGANAFLPAPTDSCLGSKQSYAPLPGCTLGTSGGDWLCTATCGHTACPAGDHQSAGDYVSSSANRDIGRSGTGWYTATAAPGCHQFFAAHGDCTATDDRHDRTCDGDLLRSSRFNLLAADANQSDCRNDHGLSAHDQLAATGIHAVWICANGPCPASRCHYGGPCIRAAGSLHSSPDPAKLRAGGHQPCGCGSGDYAFNRQCVTRIWAASRLSPVYGSVLFSSTLFRTTLLSSTLFSPAIRRAIGRRATHRCSAGLRGCHLQSAGGGSGGYDGDASDDHGRLPGQYRSDADPRCGGSRHGLVSRLCERGRPAEHRSGIRACGTGDNRDAGHG